MMNEEQTGWEDFLEQKPIYDNGKYKLVLPEKVKEAIKTTLEKQITPINRFGKCPHCNNSFDGGDIFEVLCQKEALTVSNDASKIAAMYGWTKENKKRFSNVTDHIIDDVPYCECPACKHLFEVNTGKEYRSLFDFKFAKLANQEEEIQEIEGVDDAPF